MKFFVCDDPKKIKNHEVRNIGNRYYYCHDDEINVYRGIGYDILWQGYTIEQPIEELLSDWWALKRANGNFVAVRITPQKVDYALDYFNNHKIFLSQKYGFEMSNHLPWMTIKSDDVCRNTLQYEPYVRREFSQNEMTTFFQHIHSVLPIYDYIQDSREAYNTELRSDPDELVDYIHMCMEQHAKVIKDRYPNRFIALSEGMDSALQSQYFRDDPQYMYTVVPCLAGENGHKYKKIVAEHYPNVHFEEFHVDRMPEYTYKYLNDSSTRWATILPTMKQIADCEVKPDIVMYGVNGDEMFFRDLIPHIQMLAYQYWDNDQETVIQKIREDIASKSDQYGATYTLGDDEGFEVILEQFVYDWFKTKHRSRKEAEHNMLKWTTPKFYTRAITQNNDVMCASLYNDRRIFHEVLKCPKSWIREHGMDSPIQRNILKEKFDYELVTPHKDALYAMYQGVFDNIFNATLPKALVETV